MSDTQRSAQDDLAFIKALAESGGKVTFSGSPKMAAARARQ